MNPNRRMNQQRINVTTATELNSNFQCNDLKAFERRLMETISYQRPKELLWRTVLIGNLLIAMTTSYWWLVDSTHKDMTFFESLQEHYFFSLSCLSLIFMFLLGIHKRVIQSTIIANRIRQVLYDFALAIDDSGKLIVKQNKPATSQMNMMYNRKPHHY